MQQPNCEPQVLQKQVDFQHLSKFAQQSSSINSSRKASLKPQNYPHKRVVNNKLRTVIPMYALIISRMSVVAHILRNMFAATNAIVPSLTFILCTRGVYCAFIVRRLTGNAISNRLRTTHHIASRIRGRIHVI
jgi:hypothetical protein